MLTQLLLWGLTLGFLALVSKFGSNGSGTV